MKHSAMFGGTCDDATRGPALASDTRTRLACPSANAVLRTIVNLGEELPLASADERIVHRYVEALSELFPHRLLCVQLLCAEGNDMALVYATGRIREESRSRLSVPIACLKESEVELSEGQLPVIQVTPRYQLVFERGRTGFSVPLFDGRRLRGLLTVEYARGTVVPRVDRRLFARLARHLAATLRNARLHRRAEAQRDYLDQVLDRANTPMVVTDRQGIIGLVNQAYCALTGMDRSQLLGRHLAQTLAQGDEAERLRPAQRSALRGADSSDLALRIRRREGQDLPVSASCTAVADPHGEVDGVLWMLRDEGERHALEARVMQIEKLAALGQMAAEVVHELNNPLTTICLYAEYLARKGRAIGREPGDTTKLELIGQNADRILRFSRDLMAYVRPSPDTRSAVSLSKNVEQALTFCEPLLRRASAQVERVFGETPAHVLGVEEQLLQVWVNLIINACHAMPEHSGQLRVQIGHRGPEEVFVRISDNGLGIRDEDRSRLFEPFFTTKREGQGTGLGLHIVRRIVEHHGGRIEVHSQPGSGCAFQVTLPVAPDSKAPT